jgi:hypothetical protein
MKFPPGLGETDSIVNLEENIGKVVGKMKPVPPQERYAQLLHLGRRTFGDRTPLPKGVYRFQTHQLANEWEMRQIMKRTKR